MNSCNGFFAAYGAGWQALKSYKLKRTCWYIARLTVSTERIRLTSPESIRYTRKTRYRSGKPMKNSDRPSIFKKIRDRIRYGLATQEILDRLSATFGLVIYPYYLVREQIPPNMEPEAVDDDYNIRYLVEEDMEIGGPHVSGSL